MTNRKRCQVAIVGGGVTGTALAYALSKFTNVRDMVILEKYGQVAMVNSHPLNNAQTSHDGSTETNYDLDHAHKVQTAATALRRYIDGKNDPTLSKKVRRMALAVTPEEIVKLKNRFAEFKSTYPDLWLADRQRLSEIEPNIIKGRNPNKPVLAMGSDEGYIVDYQQLARYMIQDAKILNPRLKIKFNSPVGLIKKCNGTRFGDDKEWERPFCGYVLGTPSGLVFADTVVFAAGPYSLFFAQRLGYGLEYGILSVAGTFSDAGHWLDNKVYRMQVEGRPFAEIHGDPDILDMTKTRFGPTTKVLPLMERHHYETFKDFMKLPLATTIRGLASLFKILWKRKLIWYVLKNILFDIPVVGKALFLREVRQVVPNIRYRDLKIRKGAGGIRPQIVNLQTMDLEMGDASLVGDRIIFNTTPSPGASVCLGNAHRDAKRIVEFLGQGYHFDEEAFQKELG
ncbi:MAG TPA: FAD-dependent oxidoreductase [Candidatus Paceibacterota bacterium]